MPASSTTYKVVYWPNFTGRSEAARLLLEDAGASYTIDNDVSAFLASSAASSKPFPPFACPVLVKEGGDDSPFILSQTPAIAAFLGRELGYFPSSHQDEARALQLSLNAADIVIESFNASKGDEAKATFLGGRLGQWLDVLDKSITGQPYVFPGTDPTYVDFVLLGLSNFVTALFGDEHVASRTRLSSLVQAVRDRPNIKAYYESDRAQPKLPPPKK